jgi:hypothetical protein
VAKLAPRDIHFAVVVGGTIVGLIFAALGELMLSAAYTVGGADATFDLVQGAAFFGVGSAFLLVSAILLPGLRAIRLESESPDRGP